jgi:hypothetical protein
MRIIEINTNRSRVALDMLQEAAIRYRIDIAIVCEPNFAAINTEVWTRDNRDDVAISCMGNMTVYATGQGDGYVWVELQHVVVIGVYVSPNSTVGYYTDVIDSISMLIRTTHKDVLLAGDPNAKSMLWGCPREDMRGRVLAEAINALDLECLNDGVTPTFERNNSTSILDVAFSTAALARRLICWEVLEDETLSDHRYTAMYFADIRHGEVEGWQLRKRYDIERLKASVETHMSVEIEWTPAALTEAMRAACDEVSISSRQQRRRVYWWSEEIANLRRACMAARRRLQRHNRGGSVENQQLSREEYNEARNALRRAIKSSKKEKWLSLCEDAEEDLWGAAFKIVTKRWGRKLPQVSLPLLEEAMESLFPTHHPLMHEEIAAPETQLFTQEELLRAADRIGTKRSPGLDDIPPEAIKYAVKVNSQAVLNAMNYALSHEIFPSEWKKARLVLLKKDGRPEGLATSYRPLCLLSVLGKLLEQLLLGRLSAELADRNGLSERQYGFRKGKSTVDAIASVMTIVDEAAAGTPRTRKIPVIIALDVKNAFNCAPWQIILQKLRENEISPYIRRMIQCYLTDRILYGMAEGTQVVKRLSSGVPQGSVIGPMLWNILYDDILCLPMPEGVTSIAYADDLALVVVAKTENEVMDAGNRAIELVGAWMERNGLQLAAEKTIAVAMTGRRRLCPITFRVGNSTIPVCDKLKYLGVWLDKRRAFQIHIDETAKKADRVSASLSKLMWNTGGPRQRKRQLLSSVVDSVILYAAPVWKRAMTTTRAKTKLGRIQRRMALRAACAYRTVGSEAAFVVSGIPPIELLVNERCRRHDGATKEEAREELVNAWQTRWEESLTGLWTRELIPNVRKWVERKHGQVSYWLTQFLTGHGSFGVYLKRIGKRATDTCPYCDDRDDACHTVFSCSHWEEDREQCWTETGVQTPATIVDVMIGSERHWNSITHMISTIMNKKVIDERRLQ